MIIFNRADRGNTVIAISESDNINQTTTYIETGKLKTIKIDPSKKYQREKLLLEKSRVFNNF